jgi:hypothetical protein
MEDLIRLAELIEARNAVSSDIATLVGRPAQIVGQSHLHL